jgi:hypothetical protein
MVDLSIMYLSNRFRHLEWIVRDRILLAGAADARCNRDEEWIES